MQGSGEKDLLGGGKTYYYCNRSGHFKSKATGQRHVKTQGTSKINSHCTASLTVYREKGSEGIKVKVHKTHYRHKPSLGHLRLLDSDRIAIAGQLAQGVDFQHILDNIRDNLGKEFFRIHLLTRKDIINIEGTYGLRGAQRHRDDATSVNIWVEEMKSSDISPVILYKQQGVPQPDDCDNLCDKDFVLAIQTPLQADMMKRFCNGRVVCIDGTHGTNGYDFTLITVIVIDEYGEGFPVAWCISNREDQLLLINFFTALKKRVGIVSPAWLMSDLAEQFYTAWVASFGNRPHKLVCIWHVDRAWRENLKQLKDSELEATVYHNLRVLLEETDCHKFELLLDQTIEEFTKSSTTANFGKYFQTHYANTKEQWATCYRKDAFVNTNMYVEAFHKVLKYVYMKGRVNKRLDKCIFVLLKLARDKGFERLLKIEKGKNTERISMIRSRHQSSLKLSYAQVCKTDQPLTWEVQSCDGNNNYTVTSVHNTCPQNCLLYCPDCAICVHMFQCNCADAVIRTTICKHIHLVSRLNETHSKTSLDQTVDVPGDETFKVDDINGYDTSKGHVNETALLEKLQEKSQLCDTAVFRREVQTKISVLNGHLNHIEDKETLKGVRSYISSALNLIKARQNLGKSFIVGKKQPPNKQIEQQRTFFSTKRKRKVRVRIKKPTTEEKKEICTALLEKHKSLYSPEGKSFFSSLSRNTISK